ncbi:hypothetical protein TELCIR_21429, partial [Teladorsagia circumcincta]
MDLVEESEVPERPALHRTIVVSDSEDSLHSDHGENLKKENEEDERTEVDDMQYSFLAFPFLALLQIRKQYATDDLMHLGCNGIVCTNDYIEEEADSDDELAVIKRLEKKEFERKANREKWFDDEASLSGDDIGSDLDEDGDIANEYEAEEGDNDDVPDSDVIRRQNHKLLLKQEKDREHKELVRLQDRLLADGDLGGSETNRTFRLKLREDVTVSE